MPSEHNERQRRLWQRLDDYERRSRRSLEREAAARRVRREERIRERREREEAEERRLQEEARVANQRRRYAQEEASTCPICLEPYEVGNTPIMQECLHGFHHACINQLASAHSQEVERRGGRNFPLRCPMCRRQWTKVNISKLRFNPVVNYD